MNPLPAEEECRIERVVSASSGRWKLWVIYWLAQRTCRFNELQRNLGRITHRTLTRQLSELQEAGFVVRKDFKSIPPHVEYSLTPLGKSLVPLLQAMHDWAVANADSLPEAK